MGVDTDRLREAMRAGEKRFGALAEAATDAIVTADRGGRITYFNAAAQRFFGYDALEALGQPITLLMPERFLEAHRRGFARYAETREPRVIGRTVELAGRRKDGTEFPCELSLSTWSEGTDMQFAAIIRDISERHRAEDELARQRAELERRYRELDEFAHVVSHDLKAPLRAVTYFSQWVLDDEGNQLSPDSRENLRLLRDSLERMEHMSGGLLEFARAGLVRDEVEPVDVGALLREIVATVQPPPGFRVEIQPGLPTVKAERLRLQQVFQNLVANGLEHHDRDQGRVRVGWAEEGGKVEFTVEDDGPGIPDELKERLFRMFQPIPSKGKKKRGTGVGLALVKKIVESNGGTIAVENVAPRGTRFRFTWPKARA